MDTLATPRTRTELRLPRLPAVPRRLAPVLRFAGWMTVGFTVTGLIDTLLSALLSP